MRLNGRKALITGAGRRGSIGRETAFALAREGADVAINDFGRNEEAAEVVAQIEAGGRNAVHLEGDIRSVPVCQLLVHQCAERLGGLDVLVNNAGFPFHQPLEAITEDDWDNSLDLHLKAPFFLAQASIPFMRATGRGWIVNISSELIYIGKPDLAHYSAAKGGLRTLTKSLALALAPEITVNTICPGPTATERFKADTEYVSGADRTLPRRRWGTPADVARSVVFLVSEDGDAYTGQTLDPNCGAVMD